LLQLRLRHFFWPRTLFPVTAHEEQVVLGMLIPAILLLLVRMVFTIADGFKNFAPHASLPIQLMLLIAQSLQLPKILLE